MKRQLLLFEFDDLGAILTLRAAVGPFGAEVVPVSRGDYNKTLGALADPKPKEKLKAPYTGAALGGRMMVFCGVDAQVDDLLGAIARTGAGIGCLKAVLTQYNRDWTPVWLYRELSEEHRAMQRPRK